MHGTLLSRIYSQGARTGTATTAWLQEWTVTRPLPNPPNTADYSLELAYVRAYAIDMTYTPSPILDEPPKLFRKRINSTFHTMATAATPVRGIRIETLQPNLQLITDTAQYT